jgi:DME family drug/metabolite transporter
LNQRSGQWLILGAAVLWGTTGTAQAFAPDSASSLAIGAVRLAVGGSALMIFALLRGSLQRGQSWPVAATLLGGASMAAYQPTFFAGVSQTGVAVGTMVAIGSAPIIAGVIGVIFFRERPSRNWLLATGLAIVGCSLLVMAGGQVTVNPIGVLLALGAGASYAVYTYASKVLVAKLPADAVTAVVFTLGGIFLAPLLFTLDLGWLTSARGLLVALHLGIMATALAYALYVRGLKKVKAETAVTLALGEPLTASLLGIFLLGEQLTLFGFIGVGFLFCGLALLTRTDNKV